MRAAVAANVPITYKILFNDAVAMTGGQPTDGQLTAPQITQQMHAEGVRKIVIVTDEPEKYDRASELDHSAVNAHGAIGDAWELAHGVTVHHRDELDRIQRELREYPDVSCWSTTRRVRPRSAAGARRILPSGPSSPTRAPHHHQRTRLRRLRRLFGQINCLSVEPLETEFGRKRQINQSSCNKDFSCLNGFCPSFVTVEGGSSVRPRRSRRRPYRYSPSRQFRLSPRARRLAL